MKILIIRLSSIGDIVLCTPVIRCLKMQIPDAEIHFLSKKNFEGILQTNPHIDQLHFFENYANIKSQLKPLAFDHIIDLHNNQRTFLIKRILGTKAYSFPKLNFQKWLLCNLKINLMPKIHIVERYMKTVEKLAVKNDLKGLDYFIPKADAVSLESISPNLKTGDFIAWVIGGQHSGKIFPAYKIIALANKLKQNIVLLGGPDDKEMGDEIENASRGNVLNLCGKFKLNQSADILRQSKLVITNDTGLMHIAAAFKKKIISLWGGTVPDFGMYPYLANAESIQIVAKSCLSPSSKLGKSTLLNPMPMDKIQEAEVESAIQKLLASN